MTTKPTAFISELSFSGGNTFQIEKNEKVILVGSNNSGKSQCLREILSISQDGKTDRTLVVKDLKIKKKGSSTDLKFFLEENADYVGNMYRYNNWSVFQDSISLWDYGYFQGGLHQGFIKNITTNNRLLICEQQNSISSNDQKSEPQHVLYDDDSLMKKVSGLFKCAFSKELMFDFRGGSKLPIHVGNLPNSEESFDRVSDVYVKSVRKNPLLNMQGDGMKSYAGILFETIVSDLDITLIDEPEAFLHPPQMRKLGETLALEVSGQLFIATHSSDILRGFLEGTQGNVKILRISRKDDVNVVMEASSETIQELWEKPEIRYSNALEGVFHEQTIICEDDSDCRLINSVADHISVNDQERWLDTAYVPTGGKHGVPKVADILRKIGVPIKAVFDIDFLSEKPLVEKTVKAFGGNWNDIDPLWKKVDSAVKNGRKAKSDKEIKEAIVGIIGDVSDDSPLEKGKIKQVLKQGNEWNIVKKYGEQGISNGKARSDYSLLREELEKIGIYVVPMGEMENFCPTIGLHGPKFVTKLLSGVPLDSEKLSELRDFVSKVHKGSHCVLTQ